MTEARRATREDIPAMAGIINAWIDGTKWFPRVLSDQVITEAFEGAFDQRRMWVAGDPVAGYLSLNPDTGQVAALYCARTGEGLGRALMDRAKEGRDHLFLHTHVLNRGAQRFYRREGFKEVSRHQPEPPETVEEIRMEWHA